MWLREEEKPFAKKNDSIFAVCRYQGAGVIEDSVRKMISQMKSSIKHTKKMVAMYSPVGIAQPYYQQGTDCHGNGKMQGFFFDIKRIFPDPAYRHSQGHIMAKNKGRILTE